MSAFTVAAVFRQSGAGVKLQFPAVTIDPRAVRLDHHIAHASVFEQLINQRTHSRRDDDKGNAVRPRPLHELAKSFADLHAFAERCASFRPRCAQERNLPLIAFTLGQLTGPDGLVELSPFLRRKP